MKNYSDINFTHKTAKSHLNFIFNAIASNSKNMVQVEHLISEITTVYMNLFAAKFRLMNRQNETQQNWIQSARAVYGKAISKNKQRAFNSIPAKLHKTLMYQKLSTEI